MKHPVKPTRAQKQLMKACGLNAENWHIERDTPTEMVVVHRYTGQTKTIRKEGSGE